MKQRYKERYGEIAKKKIIGIGIAGGGVGVGAGPGLVVAAKLFPQGGRQFSNKHEQQKTTRTLRRLEKKRLVKIREKNGKHTIELTKEGKQKFQNIQIEDLQIVKPPHWDGKWRIVIFDIPEEALRSARGILRAKLKEWDFYPLQKSVWVCPW